MERAVALTRFEQVAVDDLPEKIRNYTRTQAIVACTSGGSRVAWSW